MWVGSLREGFGLSWRFRSYWYMWRNRVKKCVAWGERWDRTGFGEYLYLKVGGGRGIIKEFEKKLKWG